MHFLNLHFLCIPILKAVQKTKNFKMIILYIQLENKIGTKGTKSGVEERAYRLPTNDMLAREQHDW